MAGLLSNRVALITGGTSGIGLASVRRFVSEGARVLIGDIADDAGVELANSLGGSAAFVHMDVMLEADIASAIAAAVKRFGRLDVIYNNAGAIGDPASLLDVQQDAFDRVLALDARSVLWGHKHAARQFKAQGGGGCIVTTASVAGIQAGWSPLSYTAAKHAVVGIIRHAAMELAPFGIRSNAIAPGAIPTPMVAKAFGIPVEHAAEFCELIEARLGSKQPLGRFGSAEDVANVALFLASDLSSYVSGAVLPVEGGATVQADSRLNQEVYSIGMEFLADLRQRHPIGAS
jgi:NAD(P)-dependent dehydrogenase (short-subunit alcohol dehydrogenase family)